MVEIKNNNENYKSQYIVKTLNNVYPNSVCELNFDNVFQLLIAVILSAQCTDKRVNLITRNLFKTYSTPNDFASIKQSELEKLIFSAGFYKNKAKNIIGASKAIVDKFGGEVPSDFENLLKLDGVGRKTANVVLSAGFGKDAFAVDTHVFRVSKRLGIYKGNSVLQCELKLKDFFQQKDWSRLHHQMVLFGRYNCKSQKPNCEQCAFINVCEFVKQTQNKFKNLKQIETIHKKST